MSSARRTASLLVLLASGAPACSSRDHAGHPESSDAGAPDNAATSGGARRVVLAANGALTFRDADGHTLLESVQGTRIAGGVTYSALGFSTGAEPELVPPSFDDVPKPAVPASDTRHAVTQVLSTHATANGFVAELATDDPEGRTMLLTVAETAGLVRVDAEVSKPGGVTAVYASFASPEEEAFHGFGGRRESTDLRGQAITNWVFDYRFPKVDTAYYYPQPMFLSSAGYALRVDTNRLATFRMASDLPDATRVSVADSGLHLRVETEGGTRALAAVTEVTGRHRVAPSWSMGPTLSRTIRLYVDTPDVYRAKVEEDVKRITGGDYLVEAYAYEGWAQLPADFVAATNATLTSAGIHPLLYLRSFVANDSAGTEPRGRFDEAIAKGFVATHPDGTPYTYPSPFPGADAALLDFTKPAMVSWWKGLVRQMLESGADGFMGDFGEQVLPDMVFSDGSTGMTTHNEFPILQHRATREALDDFVAEHPERDPFFFVRSGYAGSPGSAAFEGATFPGDETANFEQKTGLPSIVPDMLNRSIFGAYGFTTDIGGYADFDGKGPSLELYVRWLEAAAFTTHFRVHNSALSGVRMPWSFGPDTEGTWREMAALHLRVRPLIERLWRDAVDTGEPPIRPLWLDDPSDGARAHEDDEWRVGPDVLVAPVLSEGAVSREVWFPPGCWQLHDDGATFDGPSATAVDAPLGMLPWFTRCGTSPLGPPSAL